jgi:hypothetical protein
MYEKIWHWEPTTITEISERWRLPDGSLLRSSGTLSGCGGAGFEQKNTAVCLVEGAGTVFCGSA